MNNFNKYAPLALTLIIILLLAGAYFLVWPKYQTYAQKKTVYDIKDEEIKAKEEYLPKLEAEFEKLNQYANQVEVVRSALPSEPSVPRLLSYIERIVPENGLILDNIEASQLFATSKSKETEEKSTSVNEMKLSITGIGTYKSFKGLLKEIYLSSRIIEVTSIDFASDGENPSLFTFNLGLKTHSYK